ncbi:MAG: signal peptidase II [Clostridia bacterium]|nr:signal peptidase II [Clostridia bacterium]
MSPVICCLVVAAIAAADQLIKYAVLNSSLTQGEVISVIADFIQLRYVENTGAAFSLFEGKTEILTVFSALVMVVGIYLIFARKIKSKVMLVSVVLIMGGGLGNLIDRVVYHFVVDYIEVLFIDFPVFNFADSFITVGEFILVAYLVWDIIKDFKQGKGKAK